MSRSNLFSRGFSRGSSTENLVIPEQPKITLDSEQSEIVYSKANNIAVIAGAGSGKTRVLTERIKYLIESGVKPQNIVAVTFTNMAAEEMKLRLKDVEGVEEAFIGTIHSFANRVMKHTGEVYQIYTDEVENDLFNYLISKYADFLQYPKYLAFKDVKALYEIGQASKFEYDSFLTPSEKAEYRLFTRPFDKVEEDLREYGEEYKYRESVETLIKSRNILTFDDILKKAKQYFEDNNVRVEYLLVDEFQDVGKLEYDFLRSLEAEHEFFVGDDWQAIYGFKGGNCQLFLSIVNDPEFEVYRLTKNYRCAKSIISLGDTVIKQASNIIPKQIEAVRDTEGVISVNNKKNLDIFLAETFIKGQRKDYKDWFILCRKNEELFKVVKTLERLNIPAVTFKREGLSLDDLKRLLAENTVKVLTVHTSKGLENKNVILYGNFPVVCPPYFLNSDERKVMYVGVTRAENSLYLFR